MGGVCDRHGREVHTVRQLQGRRPPGTHGLKCNGNAEVVRK